MQIKQLLSKDEETIVALCSPRGSGSIALIRASGSNCLAIADALSKLSSNRILSQQMSHTIHHGHVITIDKTGNRTIVDEVLFFLMKAPKTFTGQDTVEISCHNNPFIIEKILNLFVSKGARPARAGEFTKRAFLEDKIDLSQAEAIQELIAAQTEEAVQRSLSQLSGSLSHYFAQLEEELIHLLTLVEASFEFLDEEQRDIDFDSLFKNKLSTIQDMVKKLQSSFDQQKHLRDGFRIALVGGVNAGKSSIFNALIGKNRAIVTNIAGTTRDSIEYSLHKDGVFWLIIDTAGIRETNDCIEAQGIERSYQEAALADIVLVIIDQSKPMSMQEEAVYEKLITTYTKKTILIVNKNDMPALFTLPRKWEQKIPYLKVSSLYGTGIQELEKLLINRIQYQCQNMESPFLLNQRQLKVITEMEINLQFIEKNFSNSIQYELVAYHIKELLEKIANITGKQISEEILDTVFSKFCIGK